MIGGDNYLRKHTLQVPLSIHHEIAGNSAGGDQDCWRSMCHVLCGSMGLLMQSSIHGAFPTHINQIIIVYALFKLAFVELS